jgi:hypothetical protein
MAEKKRKRVKRSYYGRKGGTAEYKDEMKFDIFSTLRSLRDYYDGKSEEGKKN